MLALNIEEKIFKRMKLNKEKLIPYGFIKENESYHYSKNFMKDTFKADIYIDLNEPVKANEMSQKQSSM